MEKLINYVLQNGLRGACTCGKCIDAPPNPEEHQPKGHTIDMFFLKVSIKESTKIDIFKRLVQQEFPHWLDGKEHSYLEVGGDIGDQGIALMAMGMGGLLGIWKVITPEVFGDMIPKELKKQMAGQGLITITN